MGYVYQATNKINGKKYIGHTSRSIEKRIKEHCHNAVNNPCYVFHRALNKYGIDKFDIICLFESSSCEESLKKEIELIKTLNPEYNVHVGGRGGDTFSKLPDIQKIAIRKKLSKKEFTDRLKIQAYKQRKFSDNQIRHIRKSKLSLRNLGSIYEVSPSVIHSIKHKKVYKNVR